MAKAILSITVTIDGDQRAEALVRAERAATALLKTAHKQTGYFGATVEVEEK